MTARNPNKLTSARIALELSMPGADEAWYLLETDDLGAAIEDVCEAIAGIERRCEQIRVEPGNLRSLLAGPSGPAVLVPLGSAGLTDADYATLDRLRDAVRQRWPVMVWVTNPDGAARLIHLARNFASFLLPSAGVWSDGTMTKAETDTQLKVFQAEYGLTNDQVIAQAERGELPGDADHHAWLILLGRGDLIPGRKPGEP